MTGLSLIDTAIIGTGPAGLAAALHLRIRQKSFVLLGTGQLSQKLLRAPRVDNYLGLPGLSGAQLQGLFAAHLADMDITVTTDHITTVYPMGSSFSLAGAKTIYQARTVLLCTGVHTAKPLPGEEEFLGRGVGYCATCDAPLYKGKTAAVLAYTPQAWAEALFLATIANTVWFFGQKPVDAAIPANMRIISRQPAAITGDTKARALSLQNSSLAVDGVFILRDTIAPASLLPGLATQNGFISVDSSMATNIPGCFAAGDCTGTPHQFQRAAGQGQTAAWSAVAYLDKPQPIANRKDGAP